MYRPCPLLPAPVVVVVPIPMSMRAFVLIVLGKSFMRALGMLPYPHGSPPSDDWQLKGGVCVCGVLLVRAITKTSTSNY